ncbi:hypothetical protein A3G63_00510 [Candidatus Kaiserbacteria bacterium RIFCSPLOWO2_12_FULL_52_8]|uniref:Ribosomal subunit interface protein n=1 Tax=Candidatus Kaiserbacteria bacterium RIFCSPHIGHO2_01_FULL_53_31 TaxID=1798481 RepID=A0A1F6CIH5_9BACT|nr:MAG: hypothetical protein A2678_01200 [Candidatus Kaiserbacteria bacterium RIFCSPHIGHO2_01_FULL_53_31]OGG92645.1 MAG: hypothetical protein A3G63_00510 [Candidatus Kaiserbacteria bacterium RIFCSPLOWO2_12_FULL_52_8]
MQITIKGTQYELTDGTRAFIEEKFLALDKLAQGSQSPVSLACEVEQSIAVERAGAKYRAEGNLSADGKMFHAEAWSSNLEGAVDRVRDDLMHELRQARGRKRGFIRRGGAALKRLFRFGS